MRYIILPQAFKKILPPLAGQFISLIKDSSLVSVIAITDLTKSGREIITSTFATFEVWLTVAAMYLVVLSCCRRSYSIWNGGWQSVIKAQNVVKIFSGRGITSELWTGFHEVKKGEVIVVIGPSGSGKSTFLRCLNGLETFDEGHIIIDGWTWRPQNGY